MLSYQQTPWHITTGNEEKQINSSEKQTIRKTNIAIVPHLPKILVFPFTLKGSHHFMYYKVDQYLSLLQQQFEVKNILAFQPLAHVGPGLIVGIIVTY